MPKAPIAPGAQIELRDAIWRVQRVDRTSNGRQAWRCIGISEIVRDQEAVFLEEYEPDVRVLDPRKTKLSRDLSSQHRAGRLYIESLLREVPPPDNALAIGHRAAMDALDFQLDPAWKALERPRQRILIADAVGLGKTLEAGILLSELIRRGRAKRILVVATRAMLTQFQKEMWARFTIPLVRLDSVGLQRIRAEIPTHHNPFYFYDRTIISIDTLKQNNWFRTHVEQAHWDVIVIDEAHNVATRGTGRSMRARVANLLADRCDSLILLSATPHDGKAESFASLMNMLDPTAIADPSSYTKEDIRGLYLRRFKHDVKDQLTTHIPERIVMKDRAHASAAEEEAYRLLVDLRLTELDRGATGGVLYRVGLEKALFSSPAACAEQLRAPLRRKRVADGIPAEVRRQLLDGTQTLTSDALDRAAAYLPNDPVAVDLRALAELARAVEAIDAADFSKFQRLLKTVKKLGWKRSSAKEDRLVIFTERRETLDFLAAQLPELLGLKDGQVETLHGGLSDVEQQRIVEDFGKTQAKVRLLLTTDVASEGLNLHYLCHRLIHFDVPWSLMVFQQRNGRVDRYGQTDAPQVVYLLTESVNETLRGDMRILELLITKDDQARENIGDPSAFMNVFDIEAEEQLTALAIQERISPEALSAQWDQNLDDPFALLLADGELELDEAAPTQTPPSLYRDDFDFMAEGLERLKELGGLKSETRRDDRLIEFKWPADLKRRYSKFPREARPTDGMVLLTARPERMQQALVDARGEDTAWPQHHYLWANSPVLHWMMDRARAEFGRHTAPVLMLDALVPDALGAASRRAIVISGLLPNRRGQPLVHQWFVAHFDDTRLARVEPFSDFVRDTKLQGRDLPNKGNPLDTAALEALLPAAVDAVRSRVLKAKDSFDSTMLPRLAEETTRLATLRERRLEVIAARYAKRTGPASEQKREAAERRARALFDQHEAWVTESMRTAKEPFLQVIAAFVGGSR